MCTQFSEDIYGYSGMLAWFSLPQDSTKGLVSILSFNVYHPG